MMNTVGILRIFSTINKLILTPNFSKNYCWLYNVGMPIEYFKSTDPERLVRMASEKLNEVLGDYKKSATSVLLLLSGGSALKLIEGIDVSNLGPQTTVTVLDERYSQDPEINNFAKIASSEFYAKAKEQGAHFIDTRVVENETQDDLTRRFNSALGEWMQRNPNGKIVATVGMGPDGHVSGIMPFPEDPERFAKLFEGEELVAGYDATDKNEYPERVTTTMTFLRKIDQAIVFISGKSKREAWRKFRSESGSLAQTPARVLREMSGNVFIFTDL